jgi:hypothetical protein
VTVVRQDPEQVRGNSHELAIVVALILGLLLINLATSSRFPLPWQDEIVFTDVAVNVATHNGMVSVVNSCGVPAHDPLYHFWSCNAPMFPYILGQWIKIFGFSITAVRSLNYVLFSFAVFILWLVARRMKLIISHSARITFVLMLLIGYGMCFIYRCARYDCLALLLASLVLLVFSVLNRPARLVLISLLGVLMPIAAIQLLSYCFVVGVLLMAFFRGRFFWEIVVLGVGAIVGVAVLVALFYSQGALQNFLVQLPLERNGRFISTAKDPSFAMLLAACVIMAVDQGRRHNFRLNSTLGIGLVCGLGIPLYMLTTSKFPIYYSWMAYVPLALGVAAGLASLNLRSSRLVYALTAVCIIFACLLGLPLQLASAAYYWKDRNTAQIEPLAEKYVTSSDWVYADYSAYFAVRKITPYVLMPYVIPDDYKNNISILIVSPKAFGEYAGAIVGGDWFDTGDGIVPTGHDLVPHETSFAILMQRRVDLRVYKRIPSPQKASP